MFGPQLPNTVSVTGFTWARQAGRNILYLGTTNGIYRKNLDMNEEWKFLAQTSGLIVSDLATDPLCRDRVYAGLGLAVPFGVQAGGVITTIGNGQSWALTTAGYDVDLLPVSDVDIFSDGTTRTLYVATYGRGVWSAALGAGCN